MSSALKDIAVYTYDLIAIVSPAPPKPHVHALSQGILSFYLGGHINHFFITSVNVQVLRELFDAIRKDVLKESLSRHRMTDLRGFGAHEYPPRQSTVFLVLTI